MDVSNKTFLEQKSAKPSVIKFVSHTWFNILKIHFQSVYRIVIALLSLLCFMALVIPLSIEKNIPNVLTLYLGRLVTFLGNACKGTRYLVGLEMNEIGT